MTTFDKREQGFETQFAHEEEVRFMVRARRNRLAGLWAAEKLGLSGSDAENYANAIVMSEVDNPGSDSVFERLRSDFRIKGVAQSGDQIRGILDEFMKQASAGFK
jgi:hypothetical protein